MIKKQPEGEIAECPSKAEGTCPCPTECETCLARDYAKAQRQHMIARGWHPQSECQKFDEIEKDHILIALKHIYSDKGKKPKGWCVVCDSIIAKLSPHGEQKKV